MKAIDKVKATVTSQEFKDTAKAVVTAIAIGVATQIVTIGVLAAVDVAGSKIKGEAYEPKFFKAVEPEA